MNHDLIRQIVGRFTDIAEVPEAYDTRLNAAHRKYYAIKMAEGDDDALRPFKVDKGHDYSSPLQVTNGTAYLPSDYFKVIDATVFVGGNEKQVEFLDDREFSSRKKDHIEIPTVEYPIGNIQSDRARFLPKAIRQVHFLYYRKPEVLKFGYSRVSGYIKYDPDTSVELPWDDVHAMAVIQIMLADMGIKKTIEEIKDKK